MSAAHRSDLSAPPLNTYHLTCLQAVVVVPTPAAQKQVTLEPIATQVQLPTDDHK